MIPAQKGFIPLYKIASLSCYIVPPIASNLMRKIQHRITTFGAFTAFPIDYDPKRPAGISASEPELESAKSEIKSVCDYLIDLGIPESAMAKAMSGNGWHLLIYLNELENTEANAVRFKRAGDLITEHFNLDQTIYNPSRVWKLYGTISRKGDNTEERPHREAEIWLPENLEPIDFADLESKINSALGETEKETSAPSRLPQTSAPTSQSKKLRK